MTFLKDSFPRLFRKNKTAPCKSLPDSAQQFVVPERLREEFNSSCFHGFYGGRYVAFGWLGSKGVLSLYASAVRGRLHLEGIRRVTGNWEQLLADGRQCGELSDRE
jgi:hypothetical protein